MQKNKQKSEVEKNNIKAWAKYAGLGFQMIGTMLLGVFIGMKLDQWLETSKPWFLFVFTIVFVILAVYYSIKDLIRMK